MTIKSTSKDSIIAIFEKSEFDFYLTGSRFFGVETRHSDIDFFVSAPDDNLDELKKFLKSWGFKNMEAFTPYGDAARRRAQGITDVYYSPVYNCHVQIVKNAEEKYRIQKILMENGIFRALELLSADKFDDEPLKKDLASRIWLSIYETLRSE